MLIGQVIRGRVHDASGAWSTVALWRVDIFAVCQGHICRISQAILAGGILTSKASNCALWYILSTAGNG